MPDMTAPVIAYASHLLAGAVVFSGFFFVYLRLTPYDEFKLIREGILRRRCRCPVRCSASC